MLRSNYPPVEEVAVATMEATAMAEGARPSIVVVVHLSGRTAAD